MEEIYREITDEEDDQIERYLNKVSMCGMRVLKGNKKVTYTCKKMLLCRKCGGEGKTIHQNRNEAVLKRLGKMKGMFLRQFVFTVPKNLRRKHFMSRDGLNRLIRIVMRIIKKYFGVNNQNANKKGCEPKYRLEKKAVAILHLFGDGVEFNPHVNVLIFEDFQKGNNPVLSKEQLKAIRKSYRRALQALLGVRIENVVVHYSYCFKSDDLRRSIYYMTTPLDPSVIEINAAAALDLDLVHFLILDLNNFKHVRFWGQLANSKYKKHLNESTKIHRRKCSVIKSKKQSKKSITSHSG